jgi:hypothetical protein
MPKKGLEFTKEIEARIRLACQEKLGHKPQEQEIAALCGSSAAEWSRWKRPGVRTIPEVAILRLSENLGRSREWFTRGERGPDRVEEGRAAYAARRNVVDLTRRSEDRSAAARAVVGKLRWLVEHQAEEEIGAILGTATAIVSILERGRARGRSRRRAG